MLFILSCVFIFMLFFILNKRTKILVLILICLTIGLNIVFKTPVVTGCNWEYNMKGMLSVVYVFIALLAGANFISNIIRKFSPQYADVFRKILIVNSFISAFFVSYIFFIKGIIYN